MHILGIDYGTRRIGVAVATTQIAEPLGIIPNTKNPRLSDIVTEQALDQIDKLLTEFTIEKIVVGISEGEMATKTHQFIDRLKDHTALPIDEIDETLTSVTAGAQMQHMRKRKRQGERDHLAAAIMLQDFLDLQGSQ